MGHDDPPLLEHSALKPFVTHVAGTACQQTGDVAFHHGTAITTGAGKMHLIRGAFAVSAGLSEDVKDVLGAGSGLDRLDGLGDPHGQNAACMKGLPHDDIMEPQIARHRVDLPLWPCLDALDGLLDLLDQGQHITRITWIALRYQVGKEKTGRRF